MTVTSARLSELINRVFTGNAPTAVELREICELALIGLKAKEIPKGAGHLVEPGTTVTELGRFTLPEGHELRAVTVENNKLTSVVTSKAGQSNPKLTMSVSKVPVQVLPETKGPAMNITKDMMPDHPRFRWTAVGIVFIYEAGKEDMISSLEPFALESACCIAAVHFMEKGESATAKKWLSLLKPPLVFGKDWNGWEFQCSDGNVYFKPQEEEPKNNPNCIWKRVLRTSKEVT